MTSTAYVEHLLQQAWTKLAPGRIPDMPFPRGFWPDVARLAVELALFGEDHQPDWRPTMCSRGSWPEPTPRSSPRGRVRGAGKVSAADKAANTERLLAMLQSKADSGEQSGIG